MIIAKFGGTSVASKERILNIVNIVKNELNKTVLVVSAVSGVTDAFLKKEIGFVRKIHQNLINNLFTDKETRRKVVDYIDIQLRKAEKLARRKNLTPRDMDELVSFGEIISSYLISKVLQMNGIASEQVIATNLIVTDENFQNAEFLPEETKKQVKKVLSPIINQGIVPVITGFIGSTKNSQTTTLGRGGSDYSASIIGYSLEAEEIQIWTDVDGIMTADPKIVKKARSVELVSYEEASELAVLGAKVLHPKTILPAVGKNIPVRILNTFNPHHKGTVILREISKKNYITSIACKKNIKLIHIHTPEMFRTVGFLHKIFKIFDKLAVSIDFVSTSEVSVSLTVAGKYSTTKLTEQLKELAEVEVRSNRATVSVVGRPPKNAPMIPGVVYTLFENKKIDVEMISAGASKINETVVVKEKDADNVVRILHKTFFEGVL